jgi:hypothetical protein
MLLSVYVPQTCQTCQPWRTGTARATEPETTGRQFAERLRVCWPVIVCYSGLTAGRMQRSEYRIDHGPDATGRIRSGNRGADSCTSEAAHRYRRGSGRTERRLQAPGHAEPDTIRHVTGTANTPRSCSELACRYQAALSRRIRDSYTIRPVTGSEIGPDCGRHSPRYRRQNRARTQRVFAPRSQRVDAPLSAT